jgi:hypothetical protein
MRIYKTFAYQLLPLFKGHWRHSVAVASGYWMTFREICQRFVQESDNLLNTSEKLLKAHQSGCNFSNLHEFIRLYTHFSHTV